MFTMAEHYKGSDGLEEVRARGIGPASTQGTQLVKNGYICQGMVLAVLPKPPSSKRGMERERE